MFYRKITKYIGWQICRTLAKSTLVAAGKNNVPLRVFLPALSLRNLFCYPLAFIQSLTDLHCALNTVRFCTKMPLSEIPLFSGKTGDK
ncbi:MAG: hypothetical protein ACPG4L_05825, partial [Candidatus Puniceispirillaceae bacterium]